LEEIYRLNTARLCLLLHKVPDEIEAADNDGLLDVLAINEMDMQRQQSR
jgi:hypothetical protein